MKADWYREYDYRADKYYDRPGCPECLERIVKDEAGEYHCQYCGKKVEVTDKMIEWLRTREETKTEKHKCTFGCGGEDCLEVQYVRNPATMEWQASGGKCRKCGFGFIV